MVINTQSESSVLFLHKKKSEVAGVLDGWMDVTLGLGFSDVFLDGLGFWKG